MNATLFMQNDEPYWNALWVAFIEHDIEDSHINLYEMVLALSDDAFSITSLFHYVHVMLNQDSFYNIFSDVRFKRYPSYLKEISEG